MIKTILFDLDGTLLNTIDDLADAANWVCMQRGWPTFTVEQYKHMVGNGIPSWWSGSPPRAAAPPPQLAETLAQFTARYDAHKEDKTAPYPGIPQLLKDLRAEGIRAPSFPTRRMHCAAGSSTTILPPALLRRCGAAGPVCRSSPTPPACTA